MTSPASGASVLLYSNLAALRAQVRTAVGRRPAPDVGRVEWVECATDAEVVAQLDEGMLDLLILDGDDVLNGPIGRVAGYLARSKLPAEAGAPEQVQEG